MYLIHIDRIMYLHCWLWTV